jgi:formiminoglutamate deiminase
VSASSYLLEHGWVDGELRRDVAVTVERGRFTRVGGEPGPGAQRLEGVTLPGLANVHSHAFHRALAAWAPPAGSAATWSDRWAALVGWLDPDRYHALTTAVFREMVSVGITTVGEFHYLHHQPDGVGYDEPNAMGLALVEAAREAGIRIALLDSCHLTDGVGRPLDGPGRRFTDGTAEGWQERADELTADAGGDVVVGAAIESARAVPLDDMRLVAEWADRFETPLHVHLSARRAENDELLGVYGRTPTELLAEAGVLTDRTTVVHATHLVDSDLVRLGAASCTACLCPTSEQLLGEGTGPVVDLGAAGIRTVVGTGDNVAVDLRGEVHALASGGTGGQAASLLRGATVDGHAALGFTDAGRIAVGHRADLVTLDSRVLEGAPASTSEWWSDSSPVVQVVVGGRVRHQAGGADDVRRELERAVARAWGDS